LIVGFLLYICCIFVNTALLQGWAFQAHPQYHNELCFRVLL